MQHARNNSKITYQNIRKRQIRVITKLPNTEQSSKGKVKTHKSINRQNQSTTGKLGNRNGPDLVQAFLKKWWIESRFYGANFSLPLRFKFNTSNTQIRDQSLSWLGTLQHDIKYYYHYVHSVSKMPYTYVIYENKFDMYFTC